MTISPTVLATPQQSAPYLPQTKVFAHRGASGLFPEHTRAAYTRALEEGADGLEIDVHLTRDGEPVCFHDHTVERTTDGAGPVAELTLAQLRTLDVSSWKAPRLPARYGGKNQQLMTLQDVLDLLLGAGRDVSLAVELKHPSPQGYKLEDRVLRVLLAHGWDPETSRIRAGNHFVHITFMSFNPGSLRHLGEMTPAEKLCALFCDVTDRDVAARLAHLRFSSAALKPLVGAFMRGAVRGSESLVWNRQVGLAGPGIDYVRGHKAEVKAWIARGTGLRVWTVDQPEDARLLHSLGVQEITTNHPARIIQELRGLQPVPA